MPICSFRCPRCRAGVEAEHPTSPASRRRYPSRISSVVVLPAPFGPSSAKISPSATENVTPRAASIAP